MSGTSMHEHSSPSPDWTAEQTRDAMVQALARDLRGPLADPTGAYPGAPPVLLTPGQRIDRRRDIAQLFVAADGEEVLTDTPTSRYIVGALYPTLDAAEEAELDSDQAPDRPSDRTPDDTGGIAGDVAGEPAGDLTGSDASELSDTAAPETDTGRDTGGDDDDPDLTPPVDRAGRPSSFTVSFVVTDDTDALQLQVTGGRYEPFEFTYLGAPRTGWHRVPIHEQLTVPLPTSGHARQTVTTGGLTLEVGVLARPATDGHRTVSCYLVNRTAPGAVLTQRVLFTAQLSAAIPAGHLADYPDNDADGHPEAASLRLLYRAAPVQAVGRGVDAVAHRSDPATGGMDVVRTETLPVAAVTGTTPEVTDQQGRSLRVDMDALGRWEPEAVDTVEAMISSYRTWIADKETEAGTLPPQLKATADRHLAVCRAFAADVEAGWALAASGPVHRCLRWTSQAMAAQRRSYAAKRRKVTVTAGQVTVAGHEPRGDAWWRPFQLAFLLANLAPIASPRHRRRGVVDVIWMPTGGGKTEAYLALAAFTMLHRRLSNPGPAGGGTAVLMRYTLRLLTAQQLQRAASLLCALDVLRQDHAADLGAEPFTIGAWLGRAATPNRRKDALALLSKMVRDTKGRRRIERPFLLSRCPACAAAMGDVDTEGARVLGYDNQPLQRGRARMRASCPNPACRFHLSNNARGLPVYEIDEDIYEKPPTFLVATVDKFAQLAWNEHARVLFGLDKQTGRRARRAPGLIIQDELHLISGPLGSLVGLYESALDQLFRHDDGQSPHVVAATATTRAYARQAETLYACAADDVRLVPPPGLAVDDSFFATADTAPPRVFVGVCATGVSRFPHAQMRVLAALSHAAAALEQHGAPIDPYWTNVAFFGALRDLGQAKALIATDLRGFAMRLVRATGIRAGAPRPDAERRAVRRLTDIELTSSSSSSATEALDRLAISYGEDGCVDLGLATSVIEVGVDVDRLGLLTIIRQPKTAAQYIQVAGRVGRNARTGPGLVVTVLNPLTVRDMSHYEKFTSSHARLYAAVEPASVTPFTDAALDRGLRGTLAAVVRQVRAAGVDRVVHGDLDLVRAAAAGLAARARRLAGDRVGGNVDALARTAVHEAQTAADQQLAWGVAGPQQPVQFLRPPEDPAPQRTASWPVPTSLRSVDADAVLRIDTDWLPASTGGATGPSDPNGPEDTW
ncbi:helicase-related protein [Blastococcus sp. SYSU D00669]